MVYYKSRSIHHTGGGLIKINNLHKMYERNAKTPNNSTGTKRYQTKKKCLIE